MVAFAQASLMCHCRLSASSHASAPQNMPLLRQVMSGERLQKRNVVGREEEAGRRQRRVAAPGAQAAQLARRARHMSGEAAATCSTSSAGRSSYARHAKAAVSFERYARKPGGEESKSYV